MKHRTIFWLSVCAFLISLYHCKPQAISVGKQQEILLAKKLPVYVYITSDGVNNDSLRLFTQTLLKNKKYEVIEKAELELLTKEAYARFYEEIGRKKVMDKSKIEDMMNQLPTYAQHLTIKMQVIHNNQSGPVIDSCSWGIFPVLMKTNRKYRFQNFAAEQLQGRTMKELLLILIDSITISH
jgi:hypothetical protein